MFKRQRKTVLGDAIKIKNLHVQAVSIDKPYITRFKSMFKLHRKEVLVDKLMCRHCQQTSHINRVTFLIVAMHIKDRY